MDALICTVCYRTAVDTVMLLQGCSGCNRGRTSRSCESCDPTQEGGPPCFSCYPDRNVRWAAFRTVALGYVPGRLERNDPCNACLSLTCGCGAEEYANAIYTYLEARPTIFPGFSRPPEPEEVAFPAAEMMVGVREAEFIIDGVIYCDTCWIVRAEGQDRCACNAEAPAFCVACPDRDPCRFCWPERAARHAAAMASLETLMAPLKSLEEKEDYDEDYYERLERRYA